MFFVLFEGTCHDFCPKRQVQRRMSQQQRRATVAELCRPEGLKQLEETEICAKLEGFWKNDETFKQHF